MAGRCLALWIACLACLDCLDCSPPRLASVPQRACRRHAPWRVRLPATIGPPIASAQPSAQSAASSNMSSSGNRNRNRNPSLDPSAARKRRRLATRSPPTASTDSSSASSSPLSSVSSASSHRTPAHSGSIYSPAAAPAAPAAPAVPAVPAVPATVAASSTASTTTSLAAASTKPSSASKPSLHPPHVPARELKSCTECGRRKIRCDKQRPCSACINRDEPHLCHSGTYQRLRTDRKSYATVEQFNELQHKLERLESQLVQRLPPGLPSASSSSLLSSSTTPKSVAPFSDLSLLSDLCAAETPPAQPPPRFVADEPQPPHHRIASAETVGSKLGSESDVLEKLSSDIRLAALDRSPWIDSAFSTDADGDADASGSGSGTSSLHAAFLTRLLVLFPRRHIADALIDAFFALPNHLLFHSIDRAGLHTNVDGLYLDLLHARRPSVSPAFIALLMAVFAAGLYAADPDVPQQRAALLACGWVPHAHHPAASAASLNLNHSFFNVRVAGLTGFANSDGPGGQVKLTIPFTVKAWHESCLKALHLADFLANPSFTALGALQVMGSVCLEPTQAARRDSLAASAFALARRLKFHRSFDSGHAIAERVRSQIRLTSVMALHECQAALAHPDRDGFISWPYPIPWRAAAGGTSESYDELVVRFVTLAQHVCLTVFEHSKHSTTDTIPAGIAARLCGDIERYAQSLPPEHSDPRAESQAALIPGAHRSTSTGGQAASSRGEGAGRAQELDRLVLLVNATTLRVLVLCRMAPGRRDALRGELHVAALRHLSLSARVCALCPAFFRFNHNGLLLVRSALALVLDLELGWIHASLRARVVGALGWVTAQLDALADQGVQVARLTWLIHEVVRAEPSSTGAPVRERLERLLARINAAADKMDDRAAASSRALLSNFVGPETLDRAGTIAQGPPSAAAHANGQEAFHVLHIQPDHTVHLQDSSSFTAAADACASAAHQMPHHHASSLASSAHHHQQPHPSGSAEDETPEPAQPLWSRLRMDAEVPASAYPDGSALVIGSEADLSLNAAHATDGPQDTDIPQWVSSLLEAVLNGVT